MVSKDARIFNFFKKWIYVGKKCLGSRLAYLFKKEYAKWELFKFLNTKKQSKKMVGKTDLKTKIIYVVYD